MAASQQARTDHARLAGERCLAGATPEHRGAARPQDPCLLARNRFEIGPEPLEMIEPERGDDRHVGVDDVDGVESTAHAHFENDAVGPGRSEDEQRGQCVELEKCQRVGAERVRDPLEHDDQRRCAASMSSTRMRSR
jgi:hypothetical protein